MALRSSRLAAPSQEPSAKSQAPPFWLLVALFLLGLASTSEFLREQEKLMLLCSEQFDVVTILRSAKEATAGTVWGWWHGPWIQREMPYYRPLTSMLYLAEWRLFGHRYVLYSLLSWFLHALNTTLLCAFVYRLIPGSPQRRALFGALAAGFFTVPYWGNLAVPSQVMLWWPAQGDLLSLGFGLGALLAWDAVIVRGVRADPSPCPLPETERGSRHNEAGSDRAASRADPLSVSGRRGSRALAAKRTAAGAGPREGEGSARARALPMALLALAILSKEMAYVIPPIIWLLALHRLRFNSQSRRIFILTAALALSLWLLRRWFVPEALGFKWKGFYSIEKLYYSLGGPMGQMVLVADWALPVATLGGALLLWALSRRGHWPVGALLALIWAGLSFQVLGISWIRVFMDHNPWLLARGLAYWFAVGWLWRWRREEPVLFAVGALALIHLPLLHLGGTHYLYWPAAGWAITNAVVWACAARSVG